MYGCTDSTAEREEAERRREGNDAQLELLPDLAQVLVDQIAVPAVDRVGVKADAQPRLRVLAEPDQPLAAKRHAVEILDFEIEDVQVVDEHVVAAAVSSRERASSRAGVKAPNQKFADCCAAAGDAADIRAKARARSSASTPSEARHVGCRPYEGRPTFGTKQERCQPSRGFSAGNRAEIDRLSSVAFRASARGDRAGSRGSPPASGRAAACWWRARVPLATKTARRTCS